ncbi:MAG: flagellar hook-length control protein FliK [Brevundimonas sp.]
MPSAFAMFASAPPASAGTVAAAPNGSDSETASLFSSNLADAIQGVKSDVAKTETSHRTPGRLSLPVISNTDLEAASAPDASPVLAEVINAAPDALVAIEAPASDAEQTDTAVAPSDLAAAVALPLPQTAPVVAPVAVTPSEPSLEVAATDGVSPGQTSARLEQGVVAGNAVETSDISAQQSAVVANEAEKALVETRPASSPIRNEAGQKSIAITAEASPNEQSLAQKRETAAASPPPVVTDVPTGQASTPPSPPMDQSSDVADKALAPLTTPQIPAAASPPPVAKDNATRQVSAEVKNASSLLAASDTSAVAASAPILKTAEKTAAKPVSEPAQTTGADAVSPKVETVAPKVDVKVSIQTANLTAQPVQTVAVISSLAVAEAIQAIDAEVEVPTEASDTESASVIATSQPTENAPAKAATTPVTTAAQPHTASTKAAPAEASLGQNVAQPALADHIAMADAAPTLAQGAASTETASTAVVPTLDPAMASLDPARPVEGATETRALDAATTTTQATTTSSLSRATIETTAHLAAQIARKLEGRSTRFDMVLTPEDLGRVDVSLEIGADGQLAARLAFDNPAAAAELRGRADELRRQLQDAGFQLTGDSLDFTQRDTSSGGGFDRQQQQRQSLFAGGSRLTAQADLSIAPPQGAWTNHSQTRDRVDVRV